MSTMTPLSETRVVRIDLDTPDSHPHDLSWRQPATLARYGDHVILEASHIPQLDERLAARLDWLMRRARHYGLRLTIRRPGREFVAVQ